MNSAFVEFKDLIHGENHDIEVPLDISPNDLLVALNEKYKLGIDENNLYMNFLVAENPIAFLRGNKTLEEYGIRNGSIIIYRER